MNIRHFGHALLPPPSRSACTPRLGAEGQVRHQRRRHRRRARRRQGAEDGRQLRRVREGRPLRRHHLPPRHSNFMIQGGGYDARHERSRRARRSRSKAATAWTTCAARSRWRAPWIRTRPPRSSSSTCRQRLPRPGAIARRQRLRGVRQGGIRHGGGRQDPRRSTGQQGPAPERAARRRPHQQGHPGEVTWDQDSTADQQGDITIELDDAKAPAVRQLPGT